MRIICNNDRVYVDTEFINPQVVFNCGQTFRFENKGDVVSGIAMGRRINVLREDDKLVLYPSTEHEFTKIWSDYFDLNFSYTDMEAEFARDEVLNRTLESCRGMRLLNQQPFETIISFIVSQNNNIPRIKKIVAGICREFGTHIGGDDYAFPTVEQLSRATVEDMAKLGTGYRAPYIVNSVEMLRSVSFDDIFDTEYKYAKAKLMTLPGIGPKVADCVLLFAYKKKNAFPNDVWIKRVLKKYYGFAPKNDTELVEFVNKTFGEHAGIAQQYLFHYERVETLK